MPPSPLRMSHLQWVGKNLARVCMGPWVTEYGVHGHAACEFLEASTLGSAEIFAAIGILFLEDFGEDARPTSVIRRKSVVGSIGLVSSEDATKLWSGCTARSCRRRYACLPEAEARLEKKFQRGLAEL
ncbi:hypothetical protein Q7P37_010830 [Cladosporium fusiforme]